MITSNGDNQQLLLSSVDHRTDMVARCQMVGLKKRFADNHLLRRKHEEPHQHRRTSWRDPIPLLYPALHSLEADWKLQAMWLSDANGVRRRIYRKRRLLPR